MTYYCFLEDKSFYNAKSINLGNITPPEVVYLGSNESAYFYSKATVQDIRDTRLPYGSQAMEGQLTLYFDQSKTDKDEVDLFTAIIGKDELSINELALERLFMLIDRIAYSSNESLEELDQALSEEIKYKSYYKSESVALAKHFTEAISYQDGKQVKVKVPDWIGFTFIYESATQDATYYDFKIWLNRQSFLDEYPLSTIVKVILPCDYTYILNPSKFDSAIDALVTSVDFSFGSIDERYTTQNSELGIEVGDDKKTVEDISTLDTSGLITYKTTYVISSQPSTKLPFGILFKGHTPSTMEIRKAIREYLIGNYGFEDRWRQLLPDLFVTGQFFIVPMWNNTTVRLDGTLYPSIINFSSMKNIFTTLLPNVDKDFIGKYQEILTCGQSEIFLTSIPDQLNTESFSIYEIHPTYQFHTSQDPAYVHQTDETKDFNKKLNRCMSILAGETTSDATVSSNYFDGKNYLSFTSYGTEYHVLTKNSFYDVFVEM